MLIMCRWNWIIQFKVENSKRQRKHVYAIIFWWIKIYTYTQSRRYMYAFVKPGTHWRQSRPYRQHSWPSWRRCRPRQAVEFKLLPICRQNRQQSRPHRQQSWPYRRQSTLLPICRRFRQQSTLSPVCTGLQRCSFFRDVLLLLRARPANKPFATLTSTAAFN